MRNKIDTAIDSAISAVERAEQKHFYTETACFYTCRDCGVRTTEKCKTCGICLNCCYDRVRESRVYSAAFPGVEIEDAQSMQDGLQAERDRGN